MVPEIGDAPVLVAVNDKLPEPVAGRPIAVLLLVHEYVVVPPEFEVVKFLVAVVLLHTVRSAGWSTCPVGLTLIVKVWLDPVHETALFV